MTSHPTTFQEYETSFRGFLRDLAKSSPTLSKKAYLKGSSAASLQFFNHTFSMDADFETKEVFDVDTILQVRDDLKQHYGDRFQIFQSDSEYGILMGAIEHTDGRVIEIDLMSSFESVDPDSFSSKGQLEGFDCANRGQYVKAKASDCLVNRSEPKDLIHLSAMCKQDELIDSFVRRGIANISKDPMVAEMLRDNISEIQELLNSPDELTQELLEPREGKCHVDRIDVVDFGNDLIEIVTPNIEYSKPNTNIEF